MYDGQALRKILLLVLYALPPHREHEFRHCIGMSHSTLPHNTTAFYFTSGLEVYVRCSIEVQSTALALSTMGR